MTSKKLSASVVVIGGGIIGCSTAWHLARRGVRNVMLLEQNTLTSGTTWHAAGLIGSQKQSKPVAEMAAYTRELYGTFKAEEMQNANIVGFQDNGSLALARTEDTFRMFKNTKQIGHYLGHETRLVTPQDIKRIHPFLETSDDIVGGLFTEEKDGLVNPADVTMHMAKLAREAGVEIKEQTEVTGFDFDKLNGTVKSVTTKSGEEIECEKLMIAAGGWTKQLVRNIMGKDLIPSAIAPHQYVVFEKVEGISYDLPVVRDYMYKFYLKPEAGSTFAVGIFEGDPYSHLPEVVKERNSSGFIPSTASHELFDDDIDKMETIERVLDLVPCLSSVGIKGWIHGPDTHSADHSPIMGRVWDTTNVYVTTGLNSQGIQCGAGAGLAMTEWMLDGHPQSFQTDFTSTDILRFSPEMGKHSELIEMRALEGYGTFYKTHYPNEQFESKRMTRCLPIHDKHVQSGAVFTEAFLWERPAYYLNPEEFEQREPMVHANNIAWIEKNNDPSSVITPLKYSFDHRETEWFEAEKRESILCRTSAVMIDLSSFGKIHVKGTKALDILQHICTNNLNKPDGSLIYTFMCNENGGVLADFTVGKVSNDEYYLVTLSDQPYLVANHITRYLNKNRISKDECSLSEKTEEYSVFGVMGPKSRIILENIVESSSSANLLDDSSFPQYTFQDIQLVGGIKCRALRVSFVGTLGWELHFLKEYSNVVYDLVHNAAKTSKVEFQNLGTFAMMNSLRMEKKYIHFGHDVSPLETPLDIGMAYSCKLKTSDADFIGKQALLKQKKKGVTYQLLTAVPSNDQDKPNLTFWGHGSELIYKNGEIVGHLSSGGHSHTYDTPFGLALTKKFPIRNKTDTYEVELVTKKGIEKFPITLTRKPLVANSQSEIKKIPTKLSSSPKKVSKSFI